MSMHCVFCGHHDTDVIDSRASGQYKTEVRRRRKCASCGRRVTTRELVTLERDVPTEVIEAAVDPMAEVLKRLAALETKNTA